MQSVILRGMYWMEPVFNGWMGGYKSNVIFEGVHLASEG